MKRYLILIPVAILMLASGLLVACGQKANSTEIYQNDQYGYSFGIPKTWTTTINEEEIGHTATFAPTHNQMEIIVKVSSEEALNNSYSEARSLGIDVEGMTPLELVVRYRATELINLGETVRRIDWSEHAVTTFTLIEAKDWKSWVKTCYIVDIGNFYIIEFKVLGYSESEFEEYRNQVNEICKSFHIEGSVEANYLVTYPEVIK